MSFSFSSEHRLRERSEFATVFSARRSFRGRVFELHYFRDEAVRPARLGLIVPKRFAKSAVLRNALKRQAREVFRHLAVMMPGLDIVVRVIAPVRSRAGDTTQRAIWRGELEELFRRIGPRAT